MTTLTSLIVGHLQYKLDSVISFITPELSIKSLREKYRGRILSDYKTGRVFPLPDHIRCKDGNVAVLNCGALVRIDRNLQVVAVLDDQRKYTWLRWHSTGLTAYSDRILRPISIPDDDFEDGDPIMLSAETMVIPTPCKSLQSSSNYYLYQGHAVYATHPNNLVTYLPTTTRYTLLTGGDASWLVDDHNNIWRQFRWSRGMVVVTIPLERGRVIDLCINSVIGQSNAITMLTDRNLLITFTLHDWKLSYEEAYDAVTFCDQQVVYTSDIVRDICNN